MTRQAAPVREPRAHCAWNRDTAAVMTSCSTLGRASFGHAGAGALGRVVGA